MVDLATLTGACVVALGHVTSGLMGNDAALVAALKEASTGQRGKDLGAPSRRGVRRADQERCGRRQEHRRPPGGEPSPRAMFLGKFATGYPWAHLDIAGTAWSDKEKGYLVRGATGHGVRLLVQWLRDLASTK